MSTVVVVPFRPKKQFGLKQDNETLYALSWCCGVNLVEGGSRQWQCLHCGGLGPLPYMSVGEKRYAIAVSVYFQHLNHDKLTDWVRAWLGREDVEVSIEP